MKPLRYGIVIILLFLSLLSSCAFPNAQPSTPVMVGNAQSIAILQKLGATPLYR